jgi:hypothetical protein
VVHVRDASTCMLLLFPHCPHYLGICNILSERQLPMGYLPGQILKYRMHLKLTELERI